jgi:hypothetical protein
MSSIRRWSILIAIACALVSPRTVRADEAPRVAVVDTLGPTVPAAAAAAVTRQLYATVARAGYRVVPESETARHTVALGPRMRSAVDLAGIAEATHAARAVQATLTARGTNYVTELIAVTPSGTVANAQESADAASLEAVVDRMARQLLPPVADDVTVETPPYGTQPATTALRLALQTEGAFGLSSRFFYDHFVGGRLDYAFTRSFALGAYVGYANLAGKEGRAHNVLPYLQLEYRLAPWNENGVLIPLRFGTGYLPKNGPYLRVATGPSFPLTDAVRIGFDLLAPTFFIVHDRTVVAMDVAAEVVFEL